VVELSGGTGAGWVGEGRSEDRVSRKVAVLPTPAMESRSLQPCPDVERSTQCPPAQGGERFLSGHVNKALPPFGSMEASGKKMEHGDGVKTVEKLQGKI